MWDDGLLARATRKVVGKAVGQGLERLADTIRASGGQPLELVLPDGSRLSFGLQPRVVMTVRDPDVLPALAHPTLATLGEAFVEGRIDVDGDIMDIIAIAERLAAAGGAPVTARVAAAFARHSPKQDRADIKHHYDVGNEFYRLWLDERMVYSCAYFRSDGDALDAAQAAKLDHICRKLRLAPGERFLDVGCGWGGLVLWAAERYGVHATGITLSQRQFEHVRDEVARRGLDGRVHVELRDYRDLPADASYDKIASVGMFEHVGVARLPAYFRTLRGALRPGGFVLNHGITHNGLHGENLGSGIGEFVDRYVFPGGELTHVSRVMEAMAQAGLEVFDAEALREHYAKTLWHWTERLEANAAAARAEVGEERFRVWRIYMAGSAHAFERGWLSLWQLLGGRAHPDGRLPHPLTREDVYRPA